MAELGLVRVDTRLVHGVICVTWAPQIQATKIIAVDDLTAKNSLLKKVMESSSSLVSCEVVTLEDAVKMWNENEFGDGRVLLIFKTIDYALKAKKMGLDYKKLQVGWITAAEGKVKIDSRLNMSQEEADMLNELEEDQNVEIYTQYSPQFPPVPWRETVGDKLKGVKK